MKQPQTILEKNTLVRTNAVLDSTQGMMVREGNLKCRKPNASGLIKGVVGGHGGDVYWVQHDPSEMLAPYCYTEFEVVT